MSKDPAFLLYSQDFLTGVAFFTDSQTGKYIKLMCMQHQKGHLKREHMLKICKRYDKEIFNKFKIDTEGLFYNERLEVEINKRKAYSESRRQNRLSIKTKNICETHVKHMENESLKGKGKEDLSLREGKEAIEKLIGLDQQKGTP